MSVKLIVAVRLFPDPAQEAALRETVVLCNHAANYASARAFQTGITGKQSLQRLVYGDLKAMGLSAQPAIHVARKVAESYAALRANIRAGSLGSLGSRRRQHAESRPIRFRLDAAQPFDDRCLSWQLGARTVASGPRGDVRAISHLHALPPNTPPWLPIARASRT